MKTLEKLKKKELIELITTIRPKADAYDRVCKELGIENNILDFVKKLTISLDDENESTSDAFDRGFTGGYNTDIKMSMYSS